MDLYSTTPPIMLCQLQISESIRQEEQLLDLFYDDLYCIMIYLSVIRLIEFQINAVKFSCLCNKLFQFPAQSDPVSCTFCFQITNLCIQEIQY